ncbi:type III pantothenate kinase [Candidatus Leptofilum sp.]|uniref:type III pantothenate kinase n=1 Tax=Candidatus Leptofilum sp. TaxID=3241576 RepID=UPI003B5B437F
MLLALDIGNTNITLGVWNGRSWQHTWRLLTNPSQTADEYGVILKMLLKEAGVLTAVTQAIMASVVPALSQTFAQICQEQLNVPLLNVNSSTPMGLTILADVPTAVGADRLVNAVAAFDLFQAPCIIIDMGTATKFDLVSARQEFLGGVIAPGLGLAAEALARRAAKLSQVALEAPPQTIGKNTVHAMQSGLVFGYLSLIEGLVARLKAEHPDNAQKIHILGTGGLIDLMAPHTAVLDHIDPWLTLTGLRVIHDKVKG